MTAPTYLGVKIPTAQTLASYGLSLRQWKNIARRQKGLCGICRHRPETGVLHIDHEHVAGWKRMPALERARYVRGLLCFRCNRYVLGALRPEQVEAALVYLSDYRGRNA